VHAREVIEVGEMFTEKDVADEIQNRTRGSDQDYQTSTLEKMAFALAECAAWYEDAKTALYSLNREEWGFRAKDGSQQKCTELQIFEAAQKEMNRLLERVSKMALAEKRVTLGRLQMELVIELVQSTIEHLELSQDQVKAARKFLFDKFQEKANLTKRLETEAKTKLELEAVS
jgi:hypothetical protein